MAKRRYGHTAPPTVECVIYLRVSTEEQANSALGLEAQQARCITYAGVRGWPVLSIHIDAGVSGTKRLADRPALQEAIEALHPGCCLLAYSMDRLSRVGAAGIWEITAEIEERGSSWATIEGSWDTSTAAGRLIVAFLAEVGAYEAARIAENTSKALRAKLARGEHVGRPGLGYRYVPEQIHARADGTTYTVAAHIEADPDGLETVRMARRLRANGLSWAAVAEELTLAKRRSDTGLTTWGVGSVRKICDPRRLERDAERLTIEADVPIDLRRRPQLAPRSCAECGQLIVGDFGVRRTYCSQACKARAKRFLARQRAAESALQQRAANPTA